MPHALNDFAGLLNWENLHDWIQTQSLPGSGPATAVEKLAGGTQNNVFMIWRGSERFVLRRPPVHPRSNSNATILREARVLTMLAGSDVPHPSCYATCDDLSVIGVSFYAMAALEGFSPWGELPGRYGVEPEWRRAMGEEFVRAAARLASVDYQAIGLADLGKPDAWHARQVSRWRSQLEGYRDLLNYDGLVLPYVDEIGAWLSDHLPSDGRIGIIHGDLNLCNAMFSNVAPQISGIIDWELTTLGDPMLDLGWVLASWREADDPPGQEPIVRPWDGFLSRSQLVRDYGERTGRDVSTMPWFFGLACFKLASILEGNYARAMAGLAPMDVGKRHHARALWLMTKAKQITGQWG